ncbi:bacillithiol system redox-active protein YtxJ [Alicyclobacillus tolerans]|uniref:bacillithiol system redox-active protein YtxJ n=1 Tax=Alicyclobacillus tolerans TaxID=90970 RepID=UPI001F01124C|nr:bacillithiol system redox-active protein YtxJ [Alicyclobacillus tolerans]MCF8567220.1 bacillithiol system redox-active protein YtxJ [Alicyclobacillus tolerans]
MQMLTTEEELNQALSAHPGKPVVIFKHSTQCPISAAAYRQVEQFVAADTAPVYLIRVIEERPLSNYYAEHFGVRHQSPQAIVMRDGKVLWNASHYDITAKALSNAIQ